MKSKITYASLALLGLVAASPAWSENLEIGVVAPVSGPAASYGKDLLNGANLAADDINAAGGAGGRHVALVVGDDRASPKDAAQVTQGFVSDPKMIAMVGGVTSTATFGAVPVAQKGGLPFVITLASHPDLTKEGGYIFRNSITQKQEGPAIGRMIVACLAPKTVAIIYLNNDWGVSMTGEVKKSLAAADIRIVAEEAYDAGDSMDYGAKLAKIKAANPDVIWFGSQYDDLSLILKQAQRVNLGGRPLVASTAANSTGLINVAGNAANHLYFHAPFSPASTDPVAKSFSAKYEARFHVAPSTVAAQTYEAVQIVAREAARSGFTRDGLQKALASMPPYTGLGGAITFDPATREATGKSFTPLVVQDKSFELWSDCQTKLK